MNKTHLTHRSFTTFLLSTIFVLSAHAEIAIHSSDSNPASMGFRDEPGTVYTPDSKTGEIRVEASHPHHPLYLYLDVKTPAFTQGSAPNVEFSFEYLDDGKKELSFAYDSDDPLYGSLNQPGAWNTVGGVQLMDTGAWKQKTIILDKARFSNRLNGADIRFRLVGHPRLTLRNLQFKKLDALPEPKITGNAPKGSPNILLIVFDDMNDYAGSYGDPNAKTPRLDSFVSSGLKFDRAYCQYPVCGPSRASFLTGLYPETSGVLSNTQYIRAERPDATNMLQHFKENGYWTSNVGKIFHSMTNVVERDLSTHDSDWYRNAEDPWKKKLDRQFEAEVGKINENQDAYKAFMKEKFVNPERVVQAVATDLKDEDHRDGRTATRVISYLEEQPFGDNPFFIAMGIAKPHIPYFAPKRFFDIYPKESLIFDDVPLDVWENRPRIAEDQKYKGFGATFGVNDRELRAKWLQAYLATVTFADSQFGRVMDVLDKTGLSEDTIVIVMSDHGYHIGEHFMFGKVTLFEESARVPLAIRVPGMESSGETTSSFAELVDIYPTLTDLTGVDTPEHVQGTSLVPIIEDPSVSVRDSAYTVVTRPGTVGQAIRSENWRFARWGSDKAIELYDLEDDPDEYNNLANNPEYASVVKSLLDQLNDTRQTLKAAGK
ncbi:MAG: sulfatase [Opitutales bacterium]